MMWRTHVLFGLNTLWLLAPIPPERLGYDLGTLAACAALGALIPDLDASESKIKHFKVPRTEFKPFLLAAQVVSRTDQHRGLLHSLWGVGLLAIIVLPAIFWTGWAPLAALLLGYVSHLLADSMTKSGIWLFYPSRANFYLLPAHLRFTTGSFAEDALLPLLALGILPLFLLQLLLP